MKLKKLPSLREKKRYIIFKVHAEETLSFENVSNAIWNSLLDWLGERELAKANVWIIKNLWNGKEQTGFIKCSPKYVDAVKVGLALIHQIGDSKVILQSLRVSGTIKSGKEKIKTKTN